MILFTVKFPQFSVKVDANAGKDGVEVIEDLLGKKTPLRHLVAKTKCIHNMKIQYLPRIISLLFIIDQNILATCDAFKHSNTN